MSHKYSISRHQRSVSSLEWSGLAYWRFRRFELNQKIKYFSRCSSNTHRTLGRITSCCFARCAGWSRSSARCNLWIIIPKFHIFVQTDFLALGGTIQHLILIDGNHFEYSDTVLESIGASSEGATYDPYPAIFAGVEYLTYSGAPAVVQPDLYLSRSVYNTWGSPWKRLGVILSHPEVNHPNYERGLEGSQLIELPNHQVWLNAVCFCWIISLEIDKEFF